MKSHWHAGVIYEIVPDRFNRSGDPLAAATHSHLFPAGAQLRAWDEAMQERPGHHCNEYFGGNLRGMAERIPYLRDLGIDTVYCTPFYPAPTSIKYDITDYCAVDPALGTLDDFRHLLATLHGAGIKLVIDLVLNHCSREHPWFRDAVAHPAARFRDFFTFTRHPEEYQCWRSHRIIPELNYENPEVTTAMITGPDSPVVFWARQGVDGLRLDCANDLGRDLCRLVRDTAHAINPEIFVVGEVWSYAAGWLDVLDGVQTYYPTDLILSLLTGKIAAPQFSAGLGALLAEAGPERQGRWFSMLASHDYRRLANSLGADPGPTQAATALQFLLPGAPFIYYGDEVGMVGDGHGGDPFNRASMRWERAHQSHPLTAWYQRLIRLRRERPELRTGQCQDLTPQLNTTVAFLRHVPGTPRQFGLAVVNPTAQKQEFRLFVPYSHLYDAMRLTDWFSGQNLRFSNFLDLRLDPWQVMYLAPDPGCVPNYDFFKRT